MSVATLTAAQTARKNRMGILARSSAKELEPYWQSYSENTTFTYLREPEIGLVMVRARAGGNGSRFNLGEMSVSRCSVTLSDGTIGHGYIKGRDRRHAELAALFDALTQSDSTIVSFLENLQARQKQVQATHSTKAASTKVDFYTMVRGED